MLTLLLTFHARLLEDSKSWKKQTWTLSNDEEESNAPATGESWRISMNLFQGMLNAIEEFPVIWFDFIASRIWLLLFNCVEMQIDFYSLSWSICLHFPRLAGLGLALVSCLDIYVALRIVISMECDHCYIFMGTAGCHWTHSKLSRAISAWIKRSTNKEKDGTCLWTMKRFHALTSSGKNPSPCY